MAPRKLQLEVYQEGLTQLNPPARFAPIDHRRPRSANTTADTKSRIMDALQDAFKARLKREIRQCKANINYPELYERLMAVKRMPRDIVPDTAKRLDIEPSRITIFLRDLAKETGTQSVEYWKRYATDHFDECKEEVFNEWDAEAESDEEDEYQYSDEYRAFTSSFNSIVRQDLAQPEREHVDATIRNYIRDVSNYVSDFSLQTLKIALIFSTHEFQLVNGAVILRNSQGSDLAQILPNGYFEEEVFVPNPLDANCLNDQEFTKAFELLFGDAHFNVIQSSFYGVDGQTPATLQQHSVHRLICEASHLEPVDAYHHLPAHVTKMARYQYTVNVKNMWSDNNITNKLLKRVIYRLLCVHLRPDDEAEQQAARAQRQRGHTEQRETAPTTDIPLVDVSFNHKNKNGRRQVIANERRNLARYQRLGKDDAARRSEERLATYQVVMERERQQREAQHKKPKNDTEDKEDASAADKTEQPKTNDISKGRISQLLAQIRSSLFQATPLSRSQVAKKIKDLSEHEFDVMSMIANFIKPYVPAKGNYSKLPYQLPFLLMANKVLRSTGHASQCLQILPIISPTALHALAVDADTLYRLFCSPTAPRPMVIHTFNNQVITSTSANSYKDAVFGAFFQIDYLQRLCARHGIRFANRFHILPGCQTVRVYGLKECLKQHPAAPDDPMAEAASPALISEDDQHLLRENELLEDSKEQLSRANEALKDFVRQSKSITQMKKDCKEEAASRQQVENARLAKRQLQRDVCNARENVQHHSRKLREMKRALELPTMPPVNTGKHLVNQQPCLRRAEECMFAPELDLDRAVFVGTDNGIVKTTETAYFDLERFMFHLELYCRFHDIDAPADAMEVDIADDARALDKCMKLPTTFTVSPKQLSEGIGLHAYMSSLDRKKKMSGERVLGAEAILSTHSLRSCYTTVELEEAIQVHGTHRDAIRDFHYSDSQCKKKRRFEWVKERHYDSIASQERKEAQAYYDPMAFDVQQPIMFVGDRGHCYRSQIKGHLRFGGHWKENRHARYTPTIITNEYNSSQTCLYCFGKLGHPTYRNTNNASSSASKKSKNIVKVTKGTFVCLNARCPNAFQYVCRDQVSALAIGLAGVAQLLFGATFPCFDEQSSDQRRVMFHEMAMDFLASRKI